MKFFNIQMAAQISGVSTHTIRAWEKRYHALKPQRSSSGRRQYSDEDIERLTLLSQLTNLGNSISQIATLSDGELEAVLNKVVASKEKLGQNIRSSFKKQQISPSEVINNIRLGLSVSKIDVVSHELQKAQKNLNPGSFAKEIVFPFLEEIKARRAGGLMTQDQEKSLLAIAKFHISNSIYSSSHSAIGKARVALATPEGELNPLEIMMATLLCAENKNHFFYLSTNLSAQALADSCNAVEANVLVLGVSQQDYLKENIDNYLDKLSLLLDTQTEVWPLGNVSRRSTQLQGGQKVRMFSSISELEKALKELS